MRQDRSVGESRELGENSLCFTQRVTQKYRSTPELPISFPPFKDLTGNRLPAFPAVNRQGEGRFRYEIVAGNDFEWGAAGIGISLVVPRYDPSLLLCGDANLCRHKDVAGGVK